MMHGLPTRRLTRSSSLKSALWWAITIITTIIIMWCRASSSSRPIDTITTTIITTAAITATDRGRGWAGSLAGPAFCCAQQITISAVEDGIGVRRPGGVGSERRPGGVNSTSAHFALGGLLLVHRHEVDVARGRQHQDLQHRFAGPENVDFALPRRFEHD